jgi:hypothetical protein
MEDIVGNSNSQINTSDKNSTHKFKDIEDAIQKAIDTDTSKKDSTEKSFKNYKTNSKR